MSLHFWGEDSFGQRTLTVRSRSASSPVYMDVLVVTVYGRDEIPEAIANIPQECDPACAAGCAGAGSEFCDACANLRDVHTKECITSCPIRYEQRNGYCYNSTIPEPVCHSEVPGNTLLSKRESYTTVVTVYAQPFMHNFRRSSMFVCGCWVYCLL